MQTLDEILEENAELTADEAYLRKVLICSPFAKRVLQADVVILNELIASLYSAWTQTAMLDWLASQSVSDEASLKIALRKLRQRVMVSLIVRDINGLGDLHEVMRVTSALAIVAVQFALKHIQPWLAAIYGVPVGESGAEQSLIVVGMGKLGGLELNVSSDIDLIFAYEEDGETNGAKSISNHEFFSRVGKKLIAAIDDITAEGFVFRVDMRLRPYGSEGPLACSLEMLEEYYQNQGREWERYAWIKGAVIAGPALAISQLLRPFVYRKYLDYNAFGSMRDLKVQIQRDVDRRDLHNNIKLGRGGIREIEFIAQVFQLIRGGQDASLQIRTTLGVLQLLQHKQLLPVDTVNTLSAAYVFLRNLEHRLQYVNDQQTQELPNTPEQQARIAESMNFESWDALESVIEHHRQHVDFHFRAVFSDTKGEVLANQAKSDIWLSQGNEAEHQQYLSKLGYAEPVDSLRRLKMLEQSPRYKQLPESSRKRFDGIVPLVINLAAGTQKPDVALLRMMDLLDSICRRASYLALLAEYPAALKMLTELVSASPWLAQYLTQHPILLDELLDTRNLYAVPDFAAVRAELITRLQEHQGDVERQMDVMRHFKNSAVFRFAAKDIAGELPLQTLSDYLSELANLILQVTLDCIWPTLKGKHLETPKFAVIGYGKLGGKELGYASDLDIIFLYDDAADGAAEIYARFGQRINNWLNSLTAAGMLYETDLQLRPDGASGLLVSSVEAFHEYQLNKAWVWEHQAITRGAFSAGDAIIGEKFEAIRKEVITLPRDKTALQKEVTNMRQKMRDNNKIPAGMFDIKQSEGGIIDVEFIVQYLVLAYAPTHPALAENLGNIGLLELAAKLNLIETNLANQAAEAYREYRSMQHAIKLQGETKLRVPLESVSEKVRAVKALWQQVFAE